MLVHDLTVPKTFESLEVWRDEFLIQVRLDTTYISILYVYRYIGIHTYMMYMHQSAGTDHGCSRIFGLD